MLSQDELDAAANEQLFTAAELLHYASYAFNVRAGELSADEALGIVRTQIAAHVEARLGQRHPAEWPTSW